MCREFVQYFPYKFYRSISCFMFVISVLAVVLGAYNIVWQLVTFGILTTCIAVYLWLAAKIKVRIDQWGIECIQPLCSRVNRVTWERFSCCYLFPNYKGNYFLVLSKGELLPKELRSIVWRNHLNLFLKHKEILVIPLDPLQNNNTVLKIVKAYCSVHEC